MTTLKKQKLAVLLLSALFINRAWSQAIPILNSLPGAQKVVYLDFDGQVVTGTSWNANPNQTITALPSTMTSTAIVVIWKRMVEDYMPFDVNITTDLAVFNAAPSVRRMRVIVTPTSAWYPNAGGVAYVGSFTWGGSPDTPCWVFEDQLAYSPKNIAEAASHETGHTLTLRHQSTWDNNCTKTAEYNPGVGTGVISWAPIMGVGYSKNVTIWHNGINSTTCTTIQNDHGTGNPGITTPNFLSFKADDVGNTQAAAKTLTLNSVIVIDSGLISQPADIDAFKFTICNSRYITFNIQPWALDTTNYSGANLDIGFKLYDSNDNLLLNNDPPLALKSLAGMSLTAGSYYFTIDGVGSANYSDYGSLGRYYMRIKSSSVPAVVSNFNNPSPICKGQTVMFTDASTGSPNNWNWSAPGAAPATSTLNNPYFFFNNSGTYTISLTAGSGTVAGCAVSKTVTVDECTMLSAYDATSAKFLIYPNPSSGIFNIESDSEKEYDLEIYNGVGQKVAERTGLFKQNQVDLSGLGRGIYSVVIRTSSGTAIQKMIIE